MEQMDEVIMISDAPPAPKRAKAKKSESSLLTKQKKTLELAPKSFVLGGVYTRDTPEQSLKSAKSAAYQVNVGERKAWPSEEYYAIWGEAKTRPGVYQLLIGKRPHIPEEWKEIVERAGSRKAKKAASGGDVEAVESPFDEDEDE